VIRHVKCCRHAQKKELATGRAAITKQPHMLSAKAPAGATVDNACWIVFTRSPSVGLLYAPFPAAAAAAVAAILGACAEHCCKVVRITHQQSCCMATPICC
jgi:hypothetical protein